MAATDIQTKDRAGADIDIAAKDVGGVKFPRNILTKPDGTDVDPASLAGQTAINATLTTIDGRLVNLDADMGAAADAAASSDTGSFSLIALIKRALQNWTTLLGRMPAAVSTPPLWNAASLPVRPTPGDLWRCSFASVGSGLLTTDLTLLQTGGGMAVSQSAGNLVVTTGTTTNAETIMRSARTFTGSHLLRFKLQLSQRIANNNFSVELADLVGEALAYTINSATSVTVTFPSVNPFTSANVGQFLNLSVITGAAGIPGRYAIASVSGLTVTFTVAAWPASGSGTLTLWGWNYHRVVYNGTTATSAAYDAQRRGWASGDTTATINTTASPGHVAHVQSMGSMTGLADALVASNTGYQFTPRASRVENIPDEDVPLYVWVRAWNGSTAPASTTTLTLGFISVELTGRQKVYSAGADQMGAVFAQSVNVTNSLTLAANTPTLAAGTNLAGDVGQQYRAAATGAASGAHIVSAATTNATVVKASAGKVIGWQLANTTASWVYVKLHNLAATPTAGASVSRSIGIPPNGKSEITLEGGIAFATGIGLTTVTGAADVDATAVAANAIVGDLFFA